MVIDIIDARASRLIDISSGNGSHISSENWSWAVICSI